MSGNLTFFLKEGPQEFVAFKGVEQHHVDAHKEVLELAGYKVEEEKGVHHQSGSTTA